jgi:hypothetical protein
MSAFTDRFGHWLNETVQIAARSGVDADRVESFGADVPVAAYIERAPQMTRDASGREVLRSAVVIIDETPVVQPTARITMPDGKRPRILHVERYVALIPHQELHVG